MTGQAQESEGLVSRGNKASGAIYHDRGRNGHLQDREGHPTDNRHHAGSAHRLSWSRHRDRWRHARRQQTSKTVNKGETTVTLNKVDGLVPGQNVTIGEGATLQNREGHPADNRHHRPGGSMTSFPLEKPSNSAPLDLLDFRRGGEHRQLDVLRLASCSRSQIDTSR